MKKFIAATFAALALSGMAAPFVTPNMTKRNGLTDEQYAHLWAIGKNPKVDQTTMRDWYFKSHRYRNVTNWLEVCGRTNNFAKLSYKLGEDNIELEETNALVVAENQVLVVSNRQVVAANEYLMETNAVLEVDAKKAQKVEKAAQKAKKKDEKNFNKWIEDTEKAKRKSSEEMAEFYQSILDLAKIYDKEN